MPPNDPVDPNNPVPTRYDPRIKALKQRIHQKKGPNHNLQNKLTRLRVKKFGAVQQQPNQLPWNAAYETQLGSNTRDFNNTIANITQQQGAAEQLYGFKDTSNPFNRATMLQQAYQRNRNNTLNTYAGRGQLYAGSTSNALAYDSSNYNQGYDALRREYDATNQKFAQARLGATTTKADADQAAYVKALEDAINTRPEGSPALPKYVNKFYKKKIAKAEKHHKGHRADKLRKKLKNLRNPDPMLPTPPPK